jgi:hypothetical protein
VPDVHLNDCARESVFQEKSAVIRWLDLQVQFSWFEPRFDNVGRQARLSGSATILFLLNHNVCGFLGTKRPDVERVPAPVRGISAA